MAIRDGGPRINEALAGIAGKVAELGPDLAYAEEQAEHLEARATAIERLLDVGVLEPEAAGAMAGTQDVERRLTELESELGD